jgi:hypothetical protein
VSSSNDIDEPDDEIYAEVLREAELEFESSMDWMTDQTSGVHHQPPQMDHDSDRAMHHRPPQNYQPQASGAYQPPQMDHDRAMYHQPLQNYQPQTLGAYQPPQMNPHWAMQNLNYQHQTSGVHHQPPQNYQPQTSDAYQPPQMNPHGAVQNLNYQPQALGNDAVANQGSKPPVSSIRDGSAFNKLIQRSGESPLKEETSVASGNEELEQELYDPSKFGIVTNILEKKKQGRKYIYKVEWMPNPTTGESYAPEWQTELYLRKSFKDLLDPFNARENEKSKSTKVLCACLIFVIASVIAHTILVVY